MTIASEQSKIIYVGNGSTKAFTIPFRFVRDGDLEVTVRGVGGSERVLLPGTEYTLARSEENYGGSCILTNAPLAGEVLAIRRDPPLLQDTVYEEGVPLSAKARENALDLLVMIAQANRERIDRALVLPVSSQGISPLVPQPQPDAVLAWGVDGNLVNGPGMGQISTAGQAADMAVAAADTAAMASDSAESARVAAEAARDAAQAIAGGEHNSLNARDGADAHPQSAITGLVDALAVKAATVHGHDIADIAGAGTAAGYDVGTGAGQIPTNAAIVALPVGASIIWDGDNPPDGFLERDGAAIGRTTYAALFGVIGTRFGAGDGSTTFNLPDNRGEFLRGWDHGRGVDPDRATRTDRGDGSTGDANGTRQGDSLKSHSHTYDGWEPGGGARVATEPAYTQQSMVPTSAFGGSETRPRNINVMYCIKY